MPVFRLDCSYDGTNFHGFARQPNVRTVQGEIEAVLARVLGETVDTVGAGRTDTGVHARHQVLSFRVPDGKDPERIVLAVNRILGPEVVALRCEVVDDGFHARFSAIARSYRYLVLDDPVADPLRRHTVWHFPGRLDVTSMSEAVSHLVGVHDFASFCRRREGASTERTVESAEWTRMADLAVLRIRARAFCHQMVRSIAGLSVAVGRGRLAPERVPSIIAARDRAAAPPIAPSSGLVLWEVTYP